MEKYRTYKIYTNKNFNFEKIIKIGEHIKKGDCLIDNIYSNEDGIIDDYSITDGLICIRIKQTFPIDFEPKLKIASRYSQMSTLGEILPKVEMDESA